MEKIFLGIVLFVAISTVLVNMILPRVSFAQSSPSVFGPPETLEEAKNIGTKALKIFPTGFKGIPQEALGVWKTIFQKIKNFWVNYINPWFQPFWERIERFFKKEVERRGPIIKEEFQKERKEIKTEAPRVGKSIWERLKELIK